ncbi:CoA transferase [Variovorax sp. J22P240]|uniref:CaiB/BaiF CoA transferase family protein n=1 Tax=unclassified Variovorax TaxID=663243 RepID=UPI0025790F66|nr:MULTISPECIES: CoA transferase [unclassified Variovorax]MDL9999045.1 CoA transferase [Variovorax sp. J22P240]MDM0052602.1 CoA transferase [Variovorax sp. J22R115]
MNPQAKDLPLAGVRVLEMSQIMAGPICGLMLADMGAEVIKVEKFPAGDDARGYARPGDPGLAPGFLMLNRGKRSIAIDIRQPAGQAIIKRIASSCDIVTENFRRGKLDALGLGYEHLREVNPRLVYTSISGYGPNGPMSDNGGFDLVLQAFSGLISVTGSIDGETAKPGNSVADINAGILAALGSLTAYIKRLRTGVGSKVETSLLQASLQQMYWFAAAYFHDGTVARPMGTSHPLIAPYQTFRCGEGAIALGGGNQANWRRIAEVLGHPEWLADERFTTGRDRLAHQAVLAGLITEALASHPAGHWVEVFDKAGVPVGPVHDVGQAMDHEQSRAISMVVDVDSPNGGTMRSLGLPIHFDGEAPCARSAAPTVGQQTREVLKAFGYGDGEIADLQAAKVIATLD